ncbi:hypothetical protein [Chryseosolibacter indicus]|uniref:Chromosome segregation protein SMC n=1 Tax=Chryseosolibacter indicus TaxID=2782351 RepID=A0ABS5VZM1_9BACT|nr:hypothetical protein [Chryseosolibacter indicus]MBT1706174.1 hypothetical protein [Chryseosolibacter indicus]
MEKLRSSKAIALVSTALLIASLFWLMNTKRVNGSLQAGLEKEKLRSEELLSEKLLLEKDIQKFKDQLAKLEGSNVELDNLVKQATARLMNQEAEYNRIKKENLSLVQIRKQMQELIAMQGKLQNELEDARSSYALLEAKNAALNNEIVSLQERNKMLADDLYKAMFVAVDQSQIQAVKGKSEKLTARARKTKKLIANFEVTANLKSLSFRIIDTKGIAITPNDGTIVSTITPSALSYTASTDSEVVGNKLQKVELTFIPKEKLKAGMYTVEILNENLYVGSLKVRLK